VTRPGGHPRAASGPYGRGLSSTTGDDHVRIAIVGAGRLGGTLARRLGAANHEVLVTSRRPPDELHAVVDGWPGVQPAGRDALATAEAVVLAFPWRVRHDALADVTIPGALVVDATNPFADDFTVLQTGARGSTGEIASMLPGARVVKAWNTLPAERFEPDPPSSGRLGVPIAGDDLEAKDVVRDLTGELGHTGVDVGTLEDGHRWMEPQRPLFMVPITADELRGRVQALREG
jgi:8-hydroxy-5-deazaflavin:NADPH oxidoreductase